MPDPFPTVAERRAAILALLAAKGPLTISQIATETGSSRTAVERALHWEWFQRLSTGRKALFGLSQKGTEKAVRANDDG